MLNSSNKFEVNVNCLTVGKPVTPDVAYIDIQFTISVVGTEVPNPIGPVTPSKPKNAVLPVLNR